MTNRNIDSVKNHIERKKERKKERKEERNVIITRGK